MPAHAPLVAPPGKQLHGEGIALAHGPTRAALRRGTAKPPPHRVNEHPAGPPCSQRHGHRQLLAAAVLQPLLHVTSPLTSCTSPACHDGTVTESGCAVWDRSWMGWSSPEPLLVLRSWGAPGASVLPGLCAQQKGETGCYRLYIDKAS